ncbi:MAG: 30S ribosome-binding factor RbfA [Lachnospiraceae bacterium]|jgi:ribosome-binding factor A|nr:30S ribosome-binding factor RbfA [Lachnospiraceae bacterium]
MRKNSIKNNRINGEVQRVIAQAIRESKDPRISPMTTVMEVIVAPDLKTCKVWVSVMGDAQDRDETLEGLKSAAGYIRSVVAREINLRYTPELTFYMDDSVEYAIEIGHKIDEVMAKDREAQEKRGEL